MNEYEIKIKAVLDTSDVQSKLDNLRKQQQQLVSQGASGQNKNQGQASSNLGNLGSTLNRLTGQIEALNRNLTGYRQLASKSGNSNIPGFFINNKSPELQASKLHSTMFRTVQEYFTSSGAQLKTAFGKGAIGGEEYMRRMDALQKRFSGMMKAVHQEVRSVYAAEQQMVNGSKSVGAGSGRGKGASPFTFSKDRLTRWGVGIGVHQVLGELGNYAEATGSRAGSAAMGIGQYTAMGAMAGGLPGAAIGLGMGVLSEGIKVLTDKVQALNAAYDVQVKRVREAVNIDNTYVDQKNKSNEERRAKVGDVGYFQYKVQDRQERIQKLKKDIESTGIKEGELSKYEDETRKQLIFFKERYSTSDIPQWLIDRQKNADTYKKASAELPKLEEDMTRYKTTLESLGVYDEDKQDLIDKARDVKSMGTWQVKALRSITTDDLAEAQKQKDKLIYRSKNGENISLEAFEKVQKEIDTYSDRLKILNEENGRRDDIKKQMDMKYEKQELDRLQDSLSNLKAPGMEQVNSLASQGFAISQNDDDIRWKSQMDYQKEQTNLQREIRNKIMKMSDKQETTYG